MAFNLLLFGNFKSIFLPSHYVKCRPDKYIPSSSELMIHAIEAKSNSLNSKYNSLGWGFQPVLSFAITQVQKFPFPQFTLMVYFSIYKIIPFSFIYPRMSYRAFSFQEVIHRQVIICTSPGKAKEKIYTLIAPKLIVYDFNICMNPKVFICF